MVAGETAGDGEPVRAVWQLPREAKFVREGRDHIAETARRIFASSEYVDRARLCASELLTNAVLHGTGDEIKVTELIDAGVYRVTVRDDGGTGKLVAPGQDELSCQRGDNGRGLQIVAELSDDWEEVRRGRGTTVWFEIKLPQRPVVGVGPADDGAA